MTSSQVNLRVKLEAFSQWVRKCRCSEPFPCRFPFAWNNSHVYGGIASRMYVKSLTLSKGARSANFIK
jgi:hypothetical protein